MFAVNVGVVGRPRVVDGDAAEAGQHAEVVDAFRAALGVTGDKGVLVGAGAVHPVQLARHSQPGLVETHHLGAGELVTHVGQKPVEAPGGPLGERGDGTTRQWGAEQFGQGLGGAFLGQELPDVQIHHDRGDPRPVLHRPGWTPRCAARTRIPAPPAGARSPRCVSAAGRTAGAAPRRRSAGLSANTRNRWTAKVRVPPRVLAWPPAEASSRRGRAAHPAYGRSSYATTSASAPAWPTHPTMAVCWSYQSRRPTAPPTRRYESEPAATRRGSRSAPHEAKRPARQAPHTTGA